MMKLYPTDFEDAPIRTVLGAGVYAVVVLLSYAVLFALSDGTLRVSWDVLVRYLPPVILGTAAVVVILSAVAAVRRFEVARPRDEFVFALLGLFSYFGAAVVLRYSLSLSLHPSSPSAGPLSSSALALLIVFLLVVGVVLVVVGCLLDCLGKLLSVLPFFQEDVMSTTAAGAVLGGLLIAAICAMLSLAGTFWLYPSFSSEPHVSFFAFAAAQGALLGVTLFALSSPTRPPGLDGSPSRALLQTHLDNWWRVEQGVVAIAITVVLTTLLRTLPSNGTRPTLDTLAYVVAAVGVHPFVVGVVVRAKMRFVETELAGGECECRET